MLCATRLLAAAVAIAAAGCADQLLESGDCPSPQSAVPVEDAPSDLYNGTAVACSGDDQVVCDNGRGRWETTLSDECGRTRVSLCSGCFASCSCIHLYLDDSGVGLAQVTSGTGLDDTHEWAPEEGWVELSTWTPDHLRGRVALDIGDGWVAGTFDAAPGGDPDGHADSD